MSDELPYVENDNGEFAIPCQIKIAEEDSKFGIDPASIEDFLAEVAALELNNVRIRGLMGMATFTSDENQIKEESK